MIYTGLDAHFSKENDRTFTANLKKKGYEWLIDKKVVTNATSQKACLAWEQKISLPEFSIIIEP